ncbi:hypothetical protein BLNAU_8488 [Blattamonas nauphoetae]|uniref:Uncharacterized protein n=1 Tax=Blattamonas nauphoetae TaxID=2049346 RepID=A0ABQ9XYS9_9EUKA|nr:hypothetical protein BLNAU_8488 [Blattamonas nauphoetae]
MYPSSDYPCSDCDAFLNWDEQFLKPFSEKMVVFRSLVATVKLQPAFDDSLEAKAAKLLLYVTPWNPTSAGKSVRWYRHRSALVGIFVDLACLFFHFCFDIFLLHRLHSVLQLF